MNNIDFRKQRTELLNTGTATLEQLETQLIDLSIVQSNTETPNPMFWTDEMEKVCELIISKTELLLSQELKPYDRFSIYRKQNHYCRVFLNRTLIPEYFLDSDYLEFVNNLLDLIKLAYIGANEIETIDYKIEEINLNLLKRKIEIFMNTQGNKMSIEDSHKIHQEQVAEMETLLNALIEKKDILKKSLRNLKGIELINTKIEVAELELSISTKKYYIKSYSNRKV